MLIIALRSRCSAARSLTKLSPASRSVRPALGSLFMRSKAAGAWGRVKL
jgi:hypothetical protein